MEVYLRKGNIVLKSCNELLTQYTQHTKFQLMYTTDGVVFYPLYVINSTEEIIAHKKTIINIDELSKFDQTAITELCVIGQFLMEYMPEGEVDVQLGV